MANEAILKQWQEDPIDFIVADGTGLEKGTIMTYKGDRTSIASSSGSSGVLQACAGILRREKVVDSGRTRQAHFRKGIFDLVSCSDFSGVLHPGDPVMISGVNTFCGLGSAAVGIAAALQSGMRLGVVLETVTSSSQTVEVAVNL